MKKIALTGNIASGKSIAQEFFKSLGVKVLDTDEVCHFALENNEDISSKIKVLFNLKELSRKVLADIVFNDRVKKKELENILHPLVKEEILRFFEEHKNEEFVIVAIPLLFEVGWQDMFDKTVLITANKAIRQKRLQIRNGLNLEDSILRINAQLDESEKIRLANICVENNATLAKFYQELKFLSRSLKK